MSSSLSDFYTGKRWRALLTTIKNERVNEDGLVICEYCGKPIVREYDIIGHHKIHLTEDNVDDAEIALNPLNIQLVHHRCHNYIHEKLGYSKREVFLVYGAPCSGKTTWVNNNRQDGDLVIDIDALWRAVSGCPLYVKPNKLKSVVFRLRDDLLDAVKYRYGKWNNAYVIGGYPLQAERERLVKELGAREVYVESTLEECLKRAYDSPDRNGEEYAGFIRKWFENFKQVCEESALPHEP